MESITVAAEAFRESRAEAQRRIQSDADQLPGRIRPLLLYIGKRLFDEEFNASAVRREFKPSKSTLKVFKAETGKTLAAYIKDQRMMTAKQLLERTDLEVRIIASLVKAINVQGFSSAFKSWEGRAPEEVRQAARERPQYDQLDWIRCCLRFDLGILSAEHSEMLRQVEVVRIAREVRSKVAENLATVIAGRVEREGFAAAQKICRHMVVHTPSLFEALSRGSRIEGRKNRHRGVELAELALAIVEGNAERWGQEKPNYLALGWARLSNARRVASDLDEAELAMRRAETWAGQAASPGYVKAEILFHKGSLRLFQRRYPEALDTLNEAVAVSQAAKAEFSLMDALLQRASLHLYRGEPGEAMPDLLRVQRLIPAADKRRRLGAVQQLVGAAFVAGDNERARKHLPEAQRLSAEIGDAASSFQNQWFAGLLLREDGKSKEAESVLKEARAGFLDIGERDMSAIVSLDLALLCQEQRRSSEVMSYASDALPALEALKIPEALGAFDLLSRAISEGQLHHSVLELARSRLLQPLKPVI